MGRCDLGLVFLTYRVDESLEGEERTARVAKVDGGEPCMLTKESNNYEEKRYWVREQKDG